MKTKSALKYLKNLLGRMEKNLRASLYGHKTFTCCGITAKFCVDSRWDLMRLEGDFEDFDLKSILKHVPITDDDVYWEIGACTGINSILMAKILTRHKVNVVAFEPEVKNVDIINRNIALNELSNVIVMPLALSDKSGMFKFFLDSRNTSPGQGGHSLGKRQAHKGEVYVPVITFPYVIDVFNLPKPTLVSIDVEGHELNVIKTLMQYRGSEYIKVITVEISYCGNVYRSDICKYLNDYGYNLIKYKYCNWSGGKYCMACFVKGK